MVATPFFLFALCATQCGGISKNVSDVVADVVTSPLHFVDTLNRKQSRTEGMSETNFYSKSICTESQRYEEPTCQSSNMIIRRHVSTAAAVSSTASQFQSATRGNPLHILPKSGSLLSFRLSRPHEYGNSERVIHSTATTSCRMTSGVNVFGGTDEENSTSTTSLSSSCFSNDSENDSATADPTVYINTTIPTGDRIFENVTETTQGKTRIGSFLSADETPPMAVLLLNLVTVIWGSQHAIIKTVVGDSDVADFTFLRFALASLCALPYLPGIQAFVPSNLRTGVHDAHSVTSEPGKETELQKSWRWGAELGMWMFIGFSLQAIGLLTTSAQRSGFLLYLNVKLVPFFAYILLGRNISAATWVSAFTAFSGTALLALDGQSIGLNVGDFWSVLAAAASAMFILRLEKASAEVPQSAELNAASLFVVALLSFIWAVGQREVSSANSLASFLSELWEIASSHPLELFYLGAVSTALSNFIQAKAQRSVPAERASIIYSLDPVYGALFSWIILGETLGGVQAYVGAVMVAVAAATNSLLEFSNQSSDGKDES